MNKNIHWINYLKAICLFAVYLSHCQAYYKYSMAASVLIRPFYVNAFFFISGYLLFRTQLSESVISQPYHDYIRNNGKLYLQNMFYKLVVPSVLFSTIEFFPSYMIRGREFGAVDFIVKTFGGCTYWFISALVVSEVIIFILLLTRRRNIFFYFITAWIIYMTGAFICNHNLVLIKQYPDFPWQYKEGLLAVVFLAGGGILALRKKYYKVCYFQKFGCAAAELYCDSLCYAGSV